MVRAGRGRRSYQATPAIEFRRAGPRTSEAGPCRLNVWNNVSSSLDWLGTMFVDQAEIDVRSGNGGPGCVSFRREKYVPKGGPDGGCGGDGGDIVFEVDSQMNTLTVFAGKHHWSAGNGMHGEGGNRTGKSSEDLVIRVPPGTIIFDRENNLRLKDLTLAGERVILLKGGKGGVGNRGADPADPEQRQGCTRRSRMQHERRRQMHLLAR